MSLNQKYTWADFLREHPELKEKGIKRTSDEGKKAFDAASKKAIKEHLKGRDEKIKVLRKRSEEKLAALGKKRSELVKAKKRPKVREVQKKIGRQDAWLGRLEKQSERTKMLQKNF